MARGINDYLESRAGSFPWPSNQDKPTAMNSVKGTGPARQNPSSMIPALWSAAASYFFNLKGTSTLGWLPVPCPSPCVHPPHSVLQSDPLHICSDHLLLLLLSIPTVFLPLLHSDLSNLPLQAGWWHTPILSALRRPMQRQPGYTIRQTNKPRVRLFLRHFIITVAVPLLSHLHCLIR